MSWIPNPGGWVQCQRHCLYLFHVRYLTIHPLHCSLHREKMDPTSRHRSFSQLFQLSQFFRPLPLFPDLPPVFFQGFLFLIFFSFDVLYSTLLRLLPLRFHCVGGCWDRTQDCHPDLQLGALNGWLSVASLSLQDPTV
jgi:hypothetical protein